MLLYTDMEGSDTKHVSGILPENLLLQNVAVCDVDVRKGENAVRELQTEYGADSVIFIKTDVTTVAELEGNVHKNSMLGKFLTCGGQRFEQKGLLSEYWDTGLLKQNCVNKESVFRILQHSTFMAELCDTEPLLEQREDSLPQTMRQTTRICHNNATQDSLVRALLLKSCFSELCYEECVLGLSDTGPFCHSCTVQELLVGICD